MWPREHGAYGQLLFPLATALAISPLSTPALLVAIAAVAAFFAHEPLLVLAGGRGARARREHHRRAVTWLSASTALALGAGIAALAGARPEARMLFVWPLLLAAALVALLLLKLEKSAGGEMVAALALSSVAIPVCAAAAAAPTMGVAVSVLFAGLFIVSTLAVRIVILRVRGGGDPSAVRRTRLQVAMVIAAITAAILLAPAFDLSRATAAFAVLPGLGVALALTVRPPGAGRLRTIGWTLIGTSAWTAAVLIGAFR
jgi:hypothetical protein